MTGDPEGQSAQTGGDRAARPGAIAPVCPYLGRHGDPDTHYLNPSAEHRCHATAPAGRIRIDHQEGFCYGDFVACPTFIPLSERGERAKPVVVAASSEVDSAGAVTAGLEDSGTVAVGGSAASGDVGGAGATGAGGAARSAGTGAAAGALGDELGSGAGSTAMHGDAEAHGAERRERYGLAGDPDRDERDEASGGLIAAAFERAKGFSFEEWTVYIVTTALLLVIAYFGIFQNGTGQAATSAAEPAIQARAAELAATATPTPPPDDTATPRPTRPTQDAAAPTLAVPTPIEGGLMAALSPSERGVGSFNDADKLPAYGQRNLHVGTFDGRDYIGGMLFPLTKIPAGSRINYVALELTGLSDANLRADTTYTVQMLDPAAADDWRNLTYDTIKSAPATQLRSGWVIESDDVAPRKVNVLEFSDDARDTFIQRLDQGEVAFRVVDSGPNGDVASSGGDVTISDSDVSASGEDVSAETSEQASAGDPGGESATTLPDNLFTWDTGYGEGFGSRPVLRVGFVPPPPTAGPAPGEPTEVPLIVWVSDPTPAPTATALPASAPPVLKGMILFLSDRFGKTSLMVYDPVTERVGQVTKSWPYEVEKARQLAGGGVSVAVAGRTCGSGATPVVNDDNEVLEPGDPVRDCTQLLVSSPDTDVPQEVTQSGHLHYEPAVSPDGQWIAYVSTITGTDELF
ncbi:MAG: TolB family protein, partial [Anaerolineae bacterium]